MLGVNFDFDINGSVDALKKELLEYSALRISVQMVTRPPQPSGKMAFAQSSTIMVCRDGTARIYSKVPTMKDFENPTVIELRDLQNFLAAYRARGGRPVVESSHGLASGGGGDFQR